MAEIYIKEGITIDEKEVKMEFIRASGPGGQNVNKVSTAVQLRFDVMNASSLPEDVRTRLITLAGKRVTEGGVLIINAQRYRTQERNRQDALDRLVDLIEKAAVKPKSRRKTKPSLASKKRILESKRHRSKIKNLRKSVSEKADL